MRRIVAAIIFITVLFVGLGVLTVVTLPYPEYTDAFPAFSYQEKNSIDVLVIGNSHAFTAYSPMQVWEELGVSSWVLGSGGVNAEQKLALLEQGLKTQSPRLVILELWNLDEEDYPLPNSDARNENFYRRMPFGAPKLRSAYKNFNGEITWSYIFPLMRYHSRYAELERRDVIKLLRKRSVRKSSAGAALRTEVRKREFDTLYPVDFTAQSITNVERDKRSTNLAYIKKCVKLIQDSGATPILLMSPVANVTNRTKNDLDKQVILSDELLLRIKLIDMNDPELAADAGFVFEDFRDPGHLYLWGMHKSTNWLINNVLSPEFKDSAARGYPSQSIAWWDKQVNEWKKRTDEFMNLGSQ